MKIIKLLLQILIFIGLKIKELFWNTPMQFVYAIIILIAGIIAAGWILILITGIISYQFIDISSWGHPAEVYVLTASNTVWDAFWVYSNLGGPIICLIIMGLMAIAGLFLGTCFLVEKLQNSGIKDFFKENWEESKRISEKIIK
jgi:hypothetical protein